jgi:hypothetical protein
MTTPVDEFVRRKVLPEHWEMIAMIRLCMRETAPGAGEMIYRGIPAWKGVRVLAVINPTKKDITFAFARGAEFENKYGLLKWAGKVSKHIKVKRIARMDAKVLR